MLRLVWAALAALLLSACHSSARAADLPCYPTFNCAHVGPVLWGHTPDGWWGAVYYRSPVAITLTALGMDRRGKTYPPGTVLPPDSVEGMFVVCQTSSCWSPGTFFGIITDASLLSDPVTTLKTAWTQKATVADPCLVPDPSVLSLCQAVAYAFKANWPKDVSEPAPILPPTPDVWKTPLTGTFTLYLVSSGKIVAVISSRKAPAGATCDCTKPIVSGTATFCPLQGAPVNEVTLCKKQ